MTWQLVEKSQRAPVHTSDHARGYLSHSCEASVKRTGKVLVIGPVETCTMVEPACQKLSWLPSCDAHDSLSLKVHEGCVCFLNVKSDYFGRPVHGWERLQVLSCKLCLLWSASGSRLQLAEFLTLVTGLSLESVKQWTATSTWLTESMQVKGVAS